MDLATPLLEWYGDNARSLPWRDDPDPYFVWVSEVMLQQTRVETVIPYFKRWIARFPTIESLASADLQEVLNFWEGLGYYRRARNLYRAAQLVVENFNGQLPENAQKLIKLPGIGSYTAGAIASIAFGKDEPVIDGNIRRVLARVFNLSKPADSTFGKRRLWDLAAQYLPEGEAGVYNQALMDLGAKICTPKDPVCFQCPLKEFCEAYKLGIQNERPILKGKRKQPHHIVTAAVIEWEKKVLIAQRPQDGLLGGLWEFPGGKLESGEDLRTCLKREIKEELGVEISVGGSLGIYKHAYTHFRVTLHAFRCWLNGGKPKPIGVADLRWVSPLEFSNYPMGKIDRQIAKNIFEHRSSLH